MNSSKNCFEGCVTTFGKSSSMPGKILVLLLSFFFVLPSCGPSYEEMKYREQAKMVADSVAAYATGLATDTIDGITHNFIRSADLKFKVKDVAQSSEQIRKLVAKRGGYITSSALSSTIDYSTSVRFKEDSLLESTYYKTTNTIQLRVPNKQMDSLLEEIGQLSLFLDHHNLKAEDAKMMICANHLSEKRYDSYTQTLKKASVKTSPGLNQVIKAEDKLVEIQERKDNAALSAYDLSEKINYSTVAIVIYQNEQLVRNVIPAFPEAEPFAPSFGTELKNSLEGGLYLLRLFFLLVVRGWVLILVLLILWLVLKKTGRPKKNSLQGS